MLLLLRQGRLSKWFSGIGQEAIAVGVVTALEPGRLDPAHAPQPRASSPTRGVDLPRLFRQLLGKRGRLHQGPRPHLPLRHAREAHRRDDQPPRRDAAGGRRPGAGRPARGERRVAAAFTGDGATSEGDFHEAVNLAAVWKLPVLFVVENNQYGLSTPAHEQYACRDLADRGIGYGMPGVVVDGNDVLAVHRAVAAAAERRARAATGRRCSSSRPSGCAATRRPRAPTTCRRSCSRSGRRRTRSRASRPCSIESGVCSREADVGTRPRRAQGADRRARRRGARGPGAALDAPRRSWPTSTRRACSSRGRPRRRPKREAPELRYVDAISDGLREAMRRDDRVVLLGPGHRRVRRRLQGHRGLRRGVRQGPRAQHADHRVGRASAPRSAWRSTASSPWSRCSSATSSPAASTRSSTTSPRPTTAGARACRW